MKRKWKKFVAGILSVAMLSAMCLTSGAWTYPHAYWKLHDAWAVARETRDRQQIITLAEQTYDLLSQYEICADICYNLEAKCALASWCCEMEGDLDGAILWGERQLFYAQWLTDNAVSYRDTLLNGRARLEYLYAGKEVGIYTLTDRPGLSYPGTGASEKGIWYGTPADGGQVSENTSLIYVTFGDSYGMAHWVKFFKNNSESFENAVDGGVIEVAWNFEPENTQGCLNVLEADSYIAESLRTLGRLDCTVLLRVGAEMNCWAECDPQTFIQAFRAVATRARAYDNIKLVFSPNHVSNRNYSFEDFWPGDEYVDWVGISAYHNSNYAGLCPTYEFHANTYGADAFYGEGLYDRDPLVNLRPFVRFAREHNKPFMISECGFSHRNLSTGADQTPYAVEQMTRFYSYLPMLYPEVKAVFYFDNDMAGSYDLRNSRALRDTYEKVTRESGVYLEERDQEASGWLPLDKAPLRETMKLATYAAFPGKEPCTVTYYVDGIPVAATDQVPYYYELDTTALSPGAHTVRAVAAAGQFSQGVEYTLQIEGEEAVPLPVEPPVYSQPPLPMDTVDGWAAELILDAEEKGLITGRNRGDFKAEITRLQFAELAVNLIEKATGQEIVPGDRAFTDTDDLVARKAVAAGVTAGTTDGAFLPDTPINREQICVMLNAVIRYVDGVKGTNTLTDASDTLDPGFVDPEDISGWARPFVAAITNNGLMSGKGSDRGLRMAPKDNTTVTEAVVLIRALHGKL